MSYITDLGNALIIDDGNAADYAAMVNDGQMAAGYVARDYRAHPFGSVADAFRGEIIPRSKWDDLIKRQEDDQTSPWHTFQGNGAPILDQNGFGYCWMYGTVACLMNRYQAQGIELEGGGLSAVYPASLGKNFANQGGWAGEALGYLRRFGVPTLDVHPEHSQDRRYFNDPKVKASAARHGYADYLELPSNNFDAMVSVLLDPKNPAPVTMGLPWWGHLVAGFRVVKVDARTYGVQGPNSWTKEWGDKGTFVLAESRATAYESIAIKRVIPRSQ